MKFAEKKNSDRWSFDKTYAGRKNNCIVEIHWSNSSNCWWYFISSAEGNGYNSLWDNIKFSNREDCEKAAEESVSKKN